MDLFGGSGTTAEKKKKEDSGAAASAPLFMPNCAANASFRRMRRPVNAGVGAFAPSSLSAFCVRSG